MHKGAIVGIVGTAILAAAVVLWWRGQPAPAHSASPRSSDHFGMPHIVEGDELAEIVALTDIGRERDPAGLPRALKGLDHREPLVQLEALFTIARIGSRQALPRVSQLAAAPEGPIPVAVRAAARVTTAQLLAAPAPAQTLGELRSQASALVEGAGLSPSQVPTIIARPERADKLTSVVARRSVRQIADMVLLAADRMDRPAAASPVDLGILPEAKLKADLSAVSPSQRVPYLIESLAQFTVITHQKNFQIKLLINQGPSAVPAIVAQMDKMQQERSQYSRAACSALLKALLGIGGKTATECVGRWREDPDRFIRSYARDYHRMMSAGLRRWAILAY
ncbi:MAG: HEAT repeat domain-containing protein [Armatimonadetes bacterium]|nr:HEAT repeat domain-containing protein [Armatimonadota bacterium]